MPIDKIHRCFCRTRAEETLRVLALQEHSNRRLDAYNYNAFEAARVMLFVWLAAAATHVYRWLHHAQLETPGRASSEGSSRIRMTLKSQAKYLSAMVRDIENMDSRRFFCSKNVSAECVRLACHRTVFR